MENKLCSFDQAKNYAFLLLKYRLRSEDEILKRLKRKNFTPETIEKVLAFLKERGFVDDKVFAKAWISSRLKRPLGLRRLKQELKLKGVAQEIIEQESLALRQDYFEAEIVAELVREKAKKLKGIERQKGKQRIYGYLLRRGFSPEVVIEEIKHL